MWCRILADGSLQFNYSISIAIVLYLNVNDKILCVLYLSLNALGAAKALQQQWALVQACGICPDGTVLSVFGSRAVECFESTYP